MANVSYTPAALAAYLAGRTRARSAFQSLDPQAVDVPAEHSNQASAYRQGVADEQAGVPEPAAPAVEPSGKASPPPGTPAPRPPAVPRPPAPSAPPSPAAAAEDAKRKTEAEFARILALLDGQPLEVVRQLAIDQIVRIDKVFADSPLGYRLGRIRYGSQSERQDLARRNLEAGDALARAADSEAERRRLYKLAYELSFSAGQDLAAALGDQSFVIAGLATAVRGVGGAYKDAGSAVLKTAETVVNKTADAYAVAGKELLQVGGQVAKKGEEAVRGIGGTAKTVVYVVAGGGALALLTYGILRAYQSRPERG